MQTLRQQVGRAGIVSVAAEMEVKGSFVGGLLAGSADLVMRKENGQQAIVDMKWSGAKKFPAKLKDNRHLQLAIYAELLRQMQGNWPSVAYYILDRARFVAPDDLTFPDADAVPSSTGENTAQLWQRFLETWKWRQAQVAAGFIEVAVERIEPTDESNPSEDAMAMEYLNEAYNDYQALAGWTL
jgi:predicted RecB family nuclease